jgi:excisionase family DNA binding protein
MSDPLDPSETRGAAVLTGGEPADAAPDAATLSKREAAAVLQVDERTVRRMAEDGRLTPVQGAGGTRRFRAEQVREVTVQRRVSETLTVAESQEGETAAVLFELFDEGVHPVDAVKRLRLRPAEVTAIYRQWAELRGGMFVPEAQMREMVARFFLSTPIRDAAHLVKELHRMWPKQACSECEAEQPTLCVGCAERLTVRAAQRRAAEERARRELQLFERSLGDLEGPFRHARTRSAAASRPTGDRK